MNIKKHVLLFTALACFLTSQSYGLRLLHQKVIFRSAFTAAADTSDWYKDSDRFLKITGQFLAAKQASYQQNATAADVERVLNFCSDSVQYDHILSPKIKFSFAGKDKWRDGAISHFGETRNVKITVVNHIQHQNAIVMEFSLYREVKENDSWKAITSSTVSIMEFDKNGKIKKITDYL